MEPPDKHSLDLPLMANIEAVRVQHYALDLHVDMVSNRFIGHVILCSMPVGICDSEILTRSVTQVVDTDSFKNEASTNSSTVKLTNVKVDSAERNRNENNREADSGIILQNVCTSQVVECVSATEESLVQSDCFRDVCKTQDLHDHTYHLKATENVDYVADKTVGELENTEKKRCADERDFCMILDAWDLDVHSVREIDLSHYLADKHVKERGLTDDMSKLREIIRNSVEKPLEFTCCKTCLKIWKPGTSCVHSFPRAVKIYYQTKAVGPSLKWTKDQDGRLCVYTHGHWVNNRSLFPSQDVPEALATWEACIHVTDGMVVLMSGDENATINKDNGMQTYKYSTSLEVPSSTLALAVGHWTQVNIITESLSSSWLPCRLFTPKKYLDRASDLIVPYIPKCMEAAWALLGPHPFKRLDVLIVPSSFNSLGMASPSLMFLSQSVLSADGHMLIRIAHELSHSWFGLAIGPLDWHEEWLSEGFCTYTEAVIHAKARGMSDGEFLMEREIMDYLKFRILSSELQSTEPDLQTLSSKCDKIDGDKYVRNGMNPDKGFLQLHYLKGYFLLKCLEDKVGIDRFYTFLRTLVETFLHQLVNSADVLRLYFETFPTLRSDNFSERYLSEKWLQTPGLPKVQAAQLDYSGNELVETVLQLDCKVKEFNTLLTALHWRKRRKIDLCSQFSLSSIRCVPQMLLLLDKLLEEKKIQRDILEVLNRRMHLTSSNPDVKHKWCELVIKHRCETYYEDVRNFLLNEQAMGVYLFGELMISRDKKQRKLAEDCFRVIMPDMEDGVRRVVHCMIYGT